MKKKDDPAVYTGSSGIISDSIVANNVKNATKIHNFPSNEQLNCSPAGVYVHPRDSYLTNTDKWLSTPDENKLYFQQKSLDLYNHTIDLFNNDKKTLRLLCLGGFTRIKYINNDRICIYEPSNSAGNSTCGWSLAKEDSNTEKARLSSKQRVIEILLANTDTWSYFVTFTLDKKKRDRYDLKKSYFYISKLLQRRKITYLLVPERHEDGAWHFHGLVSAEIGPYLAEFEGKALKNKYISKSLAEGKPVRHFKAYSEYFGYNIIEPCRNKEACCFYMNKYITKTFDDPNFERASRRRFFASKGLKHPYNILPSAVDLNFFKPTSFSEHTKKVYLKRDETINLVYSREGMDTLSPPAFSFKQDIDKDIGHSEIARVRESL